MDKSQSASPSDRSSKKGFSQPEKSEVKSDAARSEARLPFEPAQNRKKPAKIAAPSAAKPNSGKSDKPRKTSPPNAIATRAFAGIPEAVSQRMARRMALFCGIPTSFGMLTFILSYFIVSQHILKLPTVAVLLTSLGFFGLGVLGLSYGALSASWDEHQVGTWFGWSEFRTNFRRTIESWQTRPDEP